MLIFKILAVLLFVVIIILFGYQFLFEGTDNAKDAKNLTKYIVTLGIADFSIVSYIVYSYMGK